MTFSSIVTMIFSTFVKPFVALVVSLCVAVSSIFTGPVGEYQKLQIKAIGTDPMHLGVDFEVSVNAGIIASILGIDLDKEGAAEEMGIDDTGFAKFSDKVDLYYDLGGAKLAMTLGDADKKHGVYVDSSGIAATPEFTEAALQSILSFKPEYIDAYKKHTADYGFYADFNELFSGFEKEDYEILERSLSGTMDVYKDVFSAIADEENLKLLKKIADKTVPLSSKYYTETKVDGIKAYNFKMTGKDYLILTQESANMLSDKEFLEDYIAFVDAMMNSIDYAKIVEMQMSGLSEMEKEQLKDDAELKKQQYAEAMEKTKQELTTLLPQSGEMIKLYTNALLTGEGLVEAFGQEYAPYIALCIPFINNSAVSSTVYAKDGALFEKYEFSITNGETALMTFKYDAKVEKYEGEITAPSTAVPFGKRLTAEVLENKVGYEKAVTKGVDFIEIFWASEMTPGKDLSIKYPEFYIMYNSNNEDYQHYLDYLNDPEVTDEEKQNIPEWPEELEKRENSGSIESSAQLIDSSVYLPLRQLMENAGYEVSWDDAARKAYVTVDGEKIEMTGVIVNNKTYVKVRDFEKLGAIVTYAEDFYREDAWNDFEKVCFATISFGE